MKRIRYEIRDSQGRPQQGELDAGSLREASRLLKEQGFAVVRLEETRPGRPLLATLRRQGMRAYAAFFCRQLSVMLDSQPLDGILAALARQKGDTGYRRLVLDMHREILLGKSLADAMGKRPDVFSPGVAHMVRAGQESGSLAEVLSRLASFLEKEHAARERLGSAMLYPALLGAVSIGALAFLVLLVLPTFAALFENFEAELPLPTRLLLGLGAFLGEWGGYIPAVLLALLAGACWLYRQQAFRLQADRLLLALPLFGRLCRDVAWMHILGALAVELEGGIRIDAALGMAREIPSNRFLRRCLGEIQQGVSHGYPLAELLAACPAFPPLLVEFVAAGENAGRLEEMLQKCADYCALSAENLSSRMQAMLEPAMLLALGGIVSAFVLSIVLPLLETMDRLG